MATPINYLLKQLWETQINTVADRLAKVEDIQNRLNILIEEQRQLTETNGHAESGEKKQTDRLPQIDRLNAIAQRLGNIKSKSERLNQLRSSINILQASLQEQIPLETWQKLHAELEAAQTEYIAILTPLTEQPAYAQFSGDKVNEILQILGDQGTITIGQLITLLEQQASDILNQKEFLQLEEDIDTLERNIGILSETEIAAEQARLEGVYSRLMSHQAMFDSVQRLQSILRQLHMVLTEVNDEHVGLDQQFNIAELQQAGIDFGFINPDSPAQRETLSQLITQYGIPTWVLQQFAFVLERGVLRPFRATEDNDELLKLIERLPAIHKLNYILKAPNDRGDIENYPTLAITLEGLMQMLSMRLSYGSNDNEPVRENTGYVATGLHSSPVIAANLPVAMQHLNDLKTQFDNQVYTVTAETGNVSLGLGKLSANIEGESRPNVDALPITLVLESLPGLNKLFGIRLSEQLITQFNLEEGIYRDYFLFGPGIYITAAGFNKIFKGLLAELQAARAQHDAAAESLEVLPADLTELILRRLPADLVPVIQITAESKGISVAEVLFNNFPRPSFAVLVEHAYESRYVDYVTYRAWELVFKLDPQVDQRTYGIHFAYDDLQDLAEQILTKQNPTRIDRERAYMTVINAKTSFGLALKQMGRSTAREAIQEVIDLLSGTESAPSNVEQLIVVLQTLISHIGSISVQEFIKRYINRFKKKFFEPDYANLLVRFSDADLTPEVFEQYVKRIDAERNWYRIDVQTGKFKMSLKLIHEINKQCSMRSEHARKSSATADLRFAIVVKAAINSLNQEEQATDVDIISEEEEMEQTITPVDRAFDNLDASYLNALHSAAIIDAQELLNMLYPAWEQVEGKETFDYENIDSMRNLFSRVIRSMGNRSGELDVLIKQVEKYQHVIHRLFKYFHQHPNAGVRVGALPAFTVWAMAAIFNPQTEEELSNLRQNLLDEYPQQAEGVAQAELMQVTAESLSGVGTWYCVLEYLVDKVLDTPIATFLAERAAEEAAATADEPSTEKQSVVQHPEEIDQEELLRRMIENENNILKSLNSQAHKAKSVIESQSAMISLTLAVESNYLGSLLQILRSYIKPGSEDAVKRFENKPLPDDVSRLRVAAERLRNFTQALNDILANSLDSDKNVLIESLASNKHLDINVRLLLAIFKAGNYINVNLLQQALEILNDRIQDIEQNTPVDSAQAVQEVLTTIADSSNLSRLASRLSDLATRPRFSEIGNVLAAAAATFMAVNNDNTDVTKAERLVRGIAHGSPDYQIYTGLVAEAFKNFLQYTDQTSQGRVDTRNANDLANAAAVMSRLVYTQLAAIQGSDSVKVPFEVANPGLQKALVADANRFGVDVRSIDVRRMNKPKGVQLYVWFIDTEDGKKLMRLVLASIHS
jgi:hypothetical protein